MDRQPRVDLPDSWEDATQADGPWTFTSPAGSVLQLSLMRHSEGPVPRPDDGALRGMAEDFGCESVGAGLEVLSLRSGKSAFGSYAKAVFGQQDGRAESVVWIASIGPDLCLVTLLGGVLPDEDLAAADSVLESLEWVDCLPWCDDLFLQFCAPHYRLEDLERRGLSATRPDMESECWPAGTLLPDLQPWNSEWEGSVRAQLQRMLDSVRQDWPTYLPVDGEPDLDWVQAFDKHYTRERIDELLQRADPELDDNDYLVLCVQFGLVLGEALREALPRLEWLCDEPYWESAIVDLQTRSRVNVFHWAVKKLSEYGVDDGFRAKVLACANILQGETA